MSMDLALAEALYLLEPQPTVWAGVLAADHLAWRDVQDLEVLALASEQAATPGVVREAWYGLYAVHAGLAPSRPVRAALTALFHRAEGLPEWQRLQLSTKNDPLAAAFGAAHFAAELLDRLTPAARDALQAASQAGAHARALQAAHQALGGSGAGDGDGDGDTDTLDAALADAQQAAQAAADVLEEALDDSPAGTEQALASALGAAQEDLQEVQGVARALGLGWGHGRGVPGREAVAGLNRLSRQLWSSADLRALLDSLGWAQRLVAREQRKAQQGRERLTHVATRALDLDLLTDEELSLLLTLAPGSVSAGIFLARALDGELLHARYEGREEAGRGPLVLVRDDSGSMHGPARAHAAALALALMNALRAQGRRFVSIPFSGPGEFTVYDPGPVPDPAALLAHLEQRFGHGTEPYGPLRAAIEQVRTDPACARGDILLLTDGALPAPAEDFLDALDAARADPGLQLVAVLVGGAADGAAFADRVVALPDLVADRDRLAEALAGVV